MNTIQRLRITTMPAPVPEPSSGAMLLAGVGLVGWVVRRSHGGVR